MPAGSTYSTIATQTLGSNTANITFTSIPSTYTDVILVCQGFSDVAGSSTNGLRFRVGNGSIDSGTNYSQTSIFGNGSTAGSYRNTSIAYFEPNDVGQTSATDPGTTIIHFMNYSNTTTNKSMLARGDITLTWSSANVGLWRSTSAINQIQIYRATNNLKAGFTATIYGITAA